MSDWRWKLRLFASADLVGSTAFKATQSASPTPDWPATFREFFRDFPAFLETRYAALSAAHRRCEQFLKPWKFLGDEILFVVELKGWHEALTHVAALRSAISEFPKIGWAAKKPALKLKAVAWLAGVPVTNTELSISSGTSESLDFIGPSIDLGFRIAKFAEPRKLVLSADLALLLLDAIDDLEVDRSAYKLGFVGREILKGVIGNEPYPILWLGVPDDTFFLEEELLRVSCDPGKLKDYLRKYLDTTPKLMRPFIDGDVHPKYRSIPEEFVKLRDQMQSEDSNREYEKTSRTEPQASGPAKDLVDPRPPTDDASSTAENENPPAAT